MDIDLILFSLFSLIVLVDFTMGGWAAMQTSKVVATGKVKPFAMGVGYLMLTV